MSLITVYWLGFFMGIAFTLAVTALILISSKKDKGKQKCY